MSDNKQLSGSNWVKKYYDIYGNWSITDNDGKRELVLDDAFKTLRGPDVKFFLSQKRMENIDKREAVDIDGVFLGEISSFSGAQSYNIPDDIVMDDYESIVVHCKAYSVVWGGTNLR